MGKKKSKSKKQQVKVQPAASHTTMNHQQKMQIISAPSASFQNLKTHFSVKQSGDRTVIVGRDAVAPLVVTSVAAYSNQLNIMVSPTTLGGGTSRLSRFAELYERYRFKTLKFYHQSTSPTSVSGSFVMTYDRDPSDPTPPATFEGYQAYLGHQDTITYPVWSSPMLICSLGSCPQDGYYTNLLTGDERLAYQGQLYITNGSQLAGGSAGVVWVEYECEFWQPQLSTVTAPSELLASSPGTINDPLSTATAVVGSPLPLAQKVVGGISKTGFNIPPGAWEIVTRTINPSSGVGPVDIGASKNGTQGSSILTDLLSASNNTAEINQLVRKLLRTTDPDGTFVFLSQLGGTNPYSVVRMAVNRVSSGIL